ncbi:MULTISPECIES: AI-2E family transporter [unclassified Flavobacterium]|uniref:AI-2E family transporter n=1 Tax=unclassified Flavobacterium TaxID=196869 RepID=UPI003F93D991
MIPFSKIPKQVPVSKKFSPIVVLQYIVLLSLILYFGKILLIPLSFSLLISFILYPVCKWLEKKGFSQGLSIFISLFIILLLSGGLLYLLFNQMSEFSNEWEPFKIKLLESLNQLSSYVTERFEISLDEQLLFFKNAINNSGAEAFSLLRSLIYSVSESVFFILIIPVFSALILYHRQMLANVLYHLFPAERKETIHEILVETINAYYNFIKGMLVVYLIVGLLNSIGLAIVGVPHPFMFGFIASILTFIPYIGIMISSLLPIAISWITYNSIWYPLGVIIVFSIVQLLEAYVIFPFAVGNRLKINTLVIIIMITVGGILWGAAGMILFIPFVSIIKLIADRTDRLKSLSVLLGDGKH